MTRRAPRRVNVRTACVAVASVALCLIARADEAAPTVRAHFFAGKAELATLEEGVKLFTNRDYKLTDVPEEMIGLTFTRHLGGKPEPLDVDVPAGATLYVLCGSEAPRSDNESLVGAAEQNATLANGGWTRLADARYAVQNKADRLIATYRKTFDAPELLDLRAHDNWPGTMLATRLPIALVDDVKTGWHADTQPTADATTTQGTTRGTTRATSEPTATVAEVVPFGPTTRVAVPQATIQALAAEHAASGMLLGITTEVTLTVTRGPTTRQTSLTFATPVDRDMMLARDDALRFVRLAYPNWLADKAELTFEDKYDAHSGGSIGAALGTLILSTIEGFAIDPSVAMTGDVGASGKVQKIGAVAAKLRGAIAGKCSLVSLPAENEEQFVDGVIYNGPSLALDVQVIGAATLAEAIATVRVDRDATPAEAIRRFAIVQQKATTRPAFLKSKEAHDALATIVDLEPRHLSAKVLLALLQNKLRRTLSATATSYYVSLAVKPMVGTLVDRTRSKLPSVPSSTIRAGVLDLQKLRPIADPDVRPLIDVWIRFIQSVDAVQQHTGTAAAMQRAGQALDDEIAKEHADAAMMQRSLREGM